MNQKLTKARHGKETNIDFPYLSKLRRPSEMDKTIKKVYSN